MNRSKRKREYRQNNRKKYLEWMCHRERLINTLTPNDSFQRGDIEFLFDVKYGMKYSYVSVTNEKRLDYILESMTKYQQIDLSKYDCAIICVYTSSLYPLDQKESDSFESSLRSYFGYDKILYGTIMTEEDSREIKAILSLNKL